MAQPENRNPKGNRPPPAQDPNFNWRGLFLAVLAIALLGGAFVFKGPYGNVRELALPEFNKALEEDRVEVLP